EAARDVVAERNLPEAPRFLGQTGIMQLNHEPELTPVNVTNLQEKRYPRLQDARIAVRQLDPLAFLGALAEPDAYCQRLQDFIAEWIVMELVGLLRLGPNREAQVNQFKPQRVRMNLPLSGDLA